MRAWQKSGFKNLPQSWEISRLENIATIKKGKQRNKNTLSAVGDFPVINGGVLPSGYLNEWNTQANTITISEGGESCGYVNFIKTKFWNGGHSYSLLDIKENINPRFLYYFLKSRESFIMRLRVGSALPNIQKKDISNLKVFLPPLEEQEKIAEILNLWDAQIAEVQDLIYHKQRLKTGLMQKLFTQSLRLKGFAESWNKVRLGDITEIKRGQTITEATRIDGDIPVIAGGKQPAYFCDRYNRTGENITISSSGTAGFVNYFATPIFASDCFTIQGLENLAITKYLYYYLKSIQNKIYSLQSGSVQTHVYPSDMEGMRLHLPPLKEQEKIAEILSVADEEIELLVQKHQALETQKRALMQRLLTGKVRV